MHKFWFLFLVFIYCKNTIAQVEQTPVHVIESKLGIQKNVHDSLLIDDYHTIIRYYILDELDPDSILFYGKKILGTYNDITDRSELLLKNTYKYVSVALWMQSKFEEAIALTEEKFKRFPGMTMNEKVADFINIGLFHIELGDYIKGIEYLFDAEKILNKLLEESSDKENIAKVVSNLTSVYINLALAFENLGDHHRAIVFNEKSVEYLFQSGTQNADDLALAFGNISVQYLSLNKLEQAIVYIELAYKELDSVTQEKTKGFVKYNYASLQIKLNKLSEAEKLFQEAIGHFKSSGNTNELGQCLRDLADLYLIKGKTSDAYRYLGMAEEIFLTTKSQRDMSKLYYSFSEYYETIGNKTLAYDYLKKHIFLNNKLVSNEIKLKGLRKDFTEQYEKQLYIDSLENAKKEAINLEVLKRKDTELTARRNQQLLLGIGLMVSAILLFLVYVRYKHNLKQKKIIEQQHISLREKNKEILDSINYAKRLQDAILPGEKMIKSILPNSFIFFQPKDVVSGDFYFLDRVNENGNTLIYFAAADCTGHGVPGAMVSIVGANGLKRCIREFGLRKPSDILDRLAAMVTDSFSQSEETIRDGMDIALCCLEENTDGKKTLHYAGANNPLWIINPKRDAFPINCKVFNNNVGFEIKADKQAIGYTEQLEPFTNHSFEVQAGDTAYCFSDGFQDQFGGEGAKKYKSINFKRLLVAIYHNEIHQQKEQVKKDFYNWKGDEEQLDDVCVIGVRLM
jgi:serine phosphatase RsbU (regulator of sigma subunit)